MKRRPEGRPREARSGCLCDSLGLLCKRVARGYDHLFAVFAGKEIVRAGEYIFLYIRGVIE